MRSEREFLIDVLGRLNKTRIDYMLTGSMASNYWGIPRTTHDLDFVLVMKPDQVDQLVAAFDAGFFLQPESVRLAFGLLSDSTSLMGSRRSRPTSGCCERTILRPRPFGGECR